MTTNSVITDCICSDGICYLDDCQPCKESKSKSGGRCQGPCIVCGAVNVRLSGEPPIQFCLSAECGAEMPK